MCEDRRAGDDRLGGTQVLAQGPRTLARVHQTTTCVGASLDLKPEHPPVQPVLVLLVGQLLLREALEARVHHFVHLGVLLEELRHSLRRRALLPHPQGHGLGGLQLVEGHLRRHDVAQDVLVEVHGVVELLGLAHHRPANSDVVAVVELGRRLDDDVGAQVEGFHDEGRGEGAVAHVHEAPGLGQLRDGLDVSQEERRVRRRLAEEHLGPLGDGGLDRLDVAEIHKREVDAVLGEVHPGTPVGPAVAAVGNDDVVAGLEQRREDGECGGHAR
mmetsp:Transcript_1429/g.3098  ORF Transcript_1429/g.3098 Transcript_1429/m.3098 type:complete len:272 (+) Transcript_1429:443-1258(+)